jgi:hypothetical protein
VSFQALGWAVDQKPKRPADKLLLLGLADRHNTETGLAFPSVAWLTDFSGLDRKTVIAGLARLQDEGLLLDTGKRVGKTGQIVCYALPYQRKPADTQGHSGTPTETKGSQKRNGSTFSVKESQKRDTEPIREPIPQKASPSSVSCPPDVEPDLWRDVLAIRKAKKAPMTENALKGIQREADKAGWSLQAVMEEMVNRGWQGFKADWVADQSHNGGRRNGNGIRHDDPLAGSNALFRVGVERQAARHRGQDEELFGHSDSWAEDRTGGEGRIKRVRDTRERDWGRSG